MNQEMVGGCNFSIGSLEFMHQGSLAYYEAGILFSF